MKSQPANIVSAPARLAPRTCSPSDRAGFPFYFLVPEYIPASPDFFRAFSVIDHTLRSFPFAVRGRTSTRKKALELSAHQSFRAAFREVVLRCREIPLSQPIANSISNQ